jgi:Golgi phosphoprotein 3
MPTEAHYQPVGRLDGTTSAAHDKAIQTLLRGEAESITIDLSELEFISSAGLRVLLLAAKSALAKGGQAVLVSPRPLVAEALKLSGFEAIFLIRHDSAVAMQHPSVGAPVEPAGQPGPAVARVVSLTLAEELLLLALDDESGAMVKLAPHSLELSLAAALVMELTLEGRIDTDLEKLFVVSAVPTGNPVLDEVLAEICAEPASQPIRFWLSRLSRSRSVQVERIAQGLVDLGVLRLVEKRLLWVLRSRAYPPTSGIEQREVRHRILTLLGNTEIPDTRDALLVGLLRASGLVDKLLHEPDLSRLRERIHQIANLEEISRELTWTVQELRVLLGAMTELEGDQ